MTAPTTAGSRAPARSRAVVFDTYGDAEVLHAIDVTVAEPGPGQVRVRVRAAGVQPFDALFRSGAAQQWLPARFPQRLGNEFAGEVDAVGPDVSMWSPGDAVLGWAMLASYAEHVIVGVDEIVAKPPAMPWIEAGVLSASGQTAATAIESLTTCFWSTPPPAAWAHSRCRSPRRVGQQSSGRRASATISSCATSV